MRICVLQPSYEASESPFKGLDPSCDPSPWLKGHTVDRVALDKATAVARIVQLSREGYDLFINLCDGAWDEDRAGLEVVQALERLRLPFTGATSACYEPSKEQMKLAAYYHDVPTPAFVFAYTEADVARALDELRLPLIVKHYNGYSSVGMTRGSKVTEPAALLPEAMRFIEAFGGALIEEFVEGRELSVLVVEDEGGATALQPVECLFPPGETFKHFDLKWKDFLGMQWAMCTDEALAGRLQELSRRIFVGMGSVSYARMDFRVDARGECWFLETNPNCGIYYPGEEGGSADAILRHDPMGHQGFTDRIIRAAQARHAKRVPTVERRYSRRLGYGLVAMRNIAAGERVIQYEEQAHYLVTMDHVERHWDSHHKDWFARYAYPVTEDVYATWSPHPDDWLPLNHACDPNTWLDGLDVVARRPIARGESITMDYATFCTVRMQQFECGCGAEDCRGVIRGSDALEPWVTERYGDHISPFLRRLRS